jgi:hypothetical protein
MTTAQSPIRRLRSQAVRIAKMLKDAEQGKPTGAVDPGGKIAAARARDSIVFAVCMDDKTLKITMTWAAIKAASEAGLVEYILRQMRDARETLQ